MTRLRRLALGDWGPVVRDPLDLARLSLLAGAVYEFAAGGRYGPGLTVSFLIVWFVPRALHVPRLFDWGFFAGMSLQSWGNVTGAFKAIAFYDLVVHAVLTCFVAVLIYVFLVRVGMMSDPEEGREKHSAVGTFVACLAFAMATGVLYEIYEFAATRLLDANLRVGYADTITDLAMDTVGGLAAGGLVLLWATYGWSTTRRAPERKIEGWIADHDAASS